MFKLGAICCTSKRDSFLPRSTKEIGSWFKRERERERDFVVRSIVFSTYCVLTCFLAYVHCRLYQPTPSMLPCLFLLLLVVVVVLLVVSAKKKLPKMFNQLKLKGRYTGLKLYNHLGTLSLPPSVPLSTTFSHSHLPLSLALSPLPSNSNQIYLQACCIVGSGVSQRERERERERD